MKTETVTYHVRYKPAAFDEWWDWEKKSTSEEAVESFREYPPRANNAREAHVVRTVTETFEEYLGMPE